MTEYSLRGVRGEAEPFGSSNLPVPTISASSMPFIQRRSLWPTREAPQSCHPPERMTEYSLRGERGEAEPFGSSNLPVPTISASSMPFIQRRSSWPTREAPQSCHPPERMTQYSLRGERGEAEPFGSSNLPVPTISASSMPYFSRNARGLIGDLFSINWNFQSPKIATGSGGCSAF